MTEVNHDTEMIVIAVAPLGPTVYVHRGQNEQEYPLHFDAVRSDDTISITSESNRLLRKATVGMIYYAAPAESDEGRELEELITEIRESDEDIVEIVKRRKAVLEGDEDE